MGVVFPLGVGRLAAFNYVVPDPESSLKRSFTAFFNTAGWTDGRAIRDGIHHLGRAMPYGP